MKVSSALQFNQMISPFEEAIVNEDNDALK
jgi:hypothetical protein